MKTDCVSICVCTFKRPELLALLLASLNAQIIENESVSIIVVDNDSAESSRAVVEEISLSSSFPLEYHVEPRQGISFARNTAVGKSKSEFVAFIDDDEIASPHWLSNLLVTARQWQADAVLGPVLPRFPPNSPDWVRKCGFFDRPRHKTGETVPVEEGRTGNALVRSKWFQTELPFDPKFAHTGGEDYDFFRRMQLAGGSIRWADNAEVTEIVPTDRQRLAWIIERSLRSSSGYWGMRYGGIVTFKGIFQAAKGFIVGTLSFVGGLVVSVFSFSQAVKLFILAAKGYGRCLAITSVRIESYRAKKG